MKNKLISLLFLLPSIAFAEPRWLQKPILCGPTQDIIRDFVTDDFVPVAKADIIRNSNTETVIGKLFYIVKDEELYMIESFSITSVTCIIGKYKNFTIIKNIEDKGSTF